MYSITQSKRIQEIADYGTARERKLAEGEGTGLIWRLFSVSRFEERDGGLCVETEATALSRISRRRCASWWNPLSAAFPASRLRPPCSRRLTRCMPWGFPPRFPPPISRSISGRAIAVTFHVGRFLARQRGQLRH